MFLGSADRWFADQKTIVSEMAHLWFLYPGRFERSVENCGGGSLPDHVESKHFDPWRAESAFESGKTIVHEA